MEAVYDVQDDFPSMTDGFCFVACVCVFACVAFRTKFTSLLLFRVACNESHEDLEWAGGRWGIIGTMVSRV